jgi:hypothetical protein
MSPRSGSPTEPLWKEMLITRAFLYITFRVPVKEPPTPGSPHRAPIERDALFPEPSFNYLSFPGEWTPLHLHFSLRVPGKLLPLHVPQQGPYGERCCIYRANGVFIHLYPSESPVKEPSHENGEHIGSPSMEPHADGRPTYSGVQPGSPRGSFMIQLSLCQCHATFCLGLGRPGAH